MTNVAKISPGIATDLDAAEKALRLAQFRMTCATKGWHGFQVVAVDTVPAEDEISRVNVHVDYFPIERQLDCFSFLVRSNGTHSARLRALIIAAGMTAADDTLDSLEGRYFAARDRGRSAEDFGPLVSAFSTAAAA